jgi:MOSC domain-containing protein YiiM
MRVVSVNVGRPRPVAWRGTVIETGIFKEPVAGKVAVATLNLAGDKQADLTVHGGRAKAVYGYPSEHYEYWRKELPEMELPWGVFGENLTTEGLQEETLCIGDRLKIGSVVLMVTQPRLPCFKLGIRFGREDMVKRFLHSGRSGFYFSVVEEGELEAGAAIEIVERERSAVSVADIHRLFLGTEDDPELLERAVRLSALPVSWRDDLLMRAERRI